jgi:prepilin-type N-terminal cleavage/methylation domain-containing protein
LHAYGNVIRAISGGPERELSVSAVDEDRKGALSPAPGVGRWTRCVGLRGQRGFSLTEVLIVLVLIGIAVGGAMAAWQAYERRNQIRIAARDAKAMIYRARMLAIYRGVGHFVVIDPAARSISIVEDSSMPLASYDAGDPVVASTQWPSAVSMDLPAGAGTIVNPLSGTALTDAWSLPDPDAAAAWGTELKGILCSPDGKLKSATALPQTLGVGAIVFEGGSGKTVSLGLEGLAGTVQAYWLNGSSWEEL